MGNILGNAPIHVGRAVSVARAIHRAHPNQYETWFYFTFGENFRGPNGDGMGGIVMMIKNLMNEQDRERLLHHKTTPFCWLETSNGAIQGIGGRDRLCEWVQTKPELMENQEIKALVTTNPTIGDLFPDTSPGSVQHEKVCG